MWVVGQEGVTTEAQRGGAATKCRTRRSQSWAHREHGEENAVVSYLLCGSVWFPPWPQCSPLFGENLRKRRGVDRVVVQPGKGKEEELGEKDGEAWVVMKMCGLLVGRMDQGWMKFFVEFGGLTAENG